MALAIGRFLEGTTTQGAADAFVETEVATDIVPEDNLILKVDAIHVQISNELSALAADLAIQFSATRATKSAFTKINDPECILSDQFNFSLVTSGVAFWRQTFRYDNLSGLYLVEPSVFLQCDTVGGGAAYTLYWRIFYQEVRASEVEILRIVNNT